MVRRSFTARHRPWSADCRPRTEDAGTSPPDCRTPVLPHRQPDHFYSPNTQLTLPQTQQGIGLNSRSHTCIAYTPPPKSCQHAGFRRSFIYLDPGALQVGASQTSKPSHSLISQICEMFSLVNHHSTLVYHSTSLLGHQQVVLGRLHMFQQLRSTNSW